MGEGVYHTLFPPRHAMASYPGLPPAASALAETSSPVASPPATPLASRFYAANVLPVNVILPARPDTAPASSTSRFAPAPLPSTTDCASLREAALACDADTLFLITRQLKHTELEIAKDEALKSLASWPPARIAAYPNYLRTASLLLPSAPRWTCITDVDALTVAIEAGNAALARLILSHGGGATAGRAAGFFRPGSTFRCAVAAAVQHAGAAGIEFLDVLLSHGAATRVAALEHAAYAGNAEAVAYLLAPLLAANGGTSASAASASGIAIAGMVNGNNGNAAGSGTAVADVAAFAESVLRSDALHYAAQRGNLACAQLLIASVPNGTTAIWGASRHTALEVAVGASLVPLASHVLSLLPGGPPNHTVVRGSTRMHCRHAACDGNGSILQQLGTASTVYFTNPCQSTATHQSAVFYKQCATGGLHYNTQFNARSTLLRFNTFSVFEC